jgi:endonuclease YncB( thermonuclease family)
MRIRRLARSFLVLLLATGLLAAIRHFLPADLEGRATVADGDTIELEGERVRLSGIDAPEFNQTCQRDGTAVACGRMARGHLVALIDGDAVACKSAGRDRYDRLLAECFVGTENLNAAMVRDGWALSGGDYPAEEARARSGKRGLWAMGFDDPRDWRADHPREDAVPDARGLAARIGHAIAAIAKWLKALFA